MDNDKLDLPLEVDPLKTPYRVYFQSIRDFLRQKDFESLLTNPPSPPFSKGGLGGFSDELDEIIIRSEKHGALYHPASIEVIIKGDSVKFGLNVAVTDTGKDLLKKEFIVLKTLHEKFNLPYIPKPYFMDELNSMVFLLEEWFEGYHEFHLSMTESGVQSIKLWEFGKGYKYLTSEQSFEIYRQASKILTLYYGMNDFCQIYPWHHAAGDFVVKIELENNPPSPPFTKGGDSESPTLKKGDLGGFTGEKIDVRLTTARQYEPYMIFQEKENMNPIIALFYFLLNLTIKMRLDKLDGVGDTVWAEDFCLEATMKGFLDGLRLKEEFKNYFSSEKEFFNILKSFRLEDLKTAYSPLIDLYNMTGDYPVIAENLDRHVEALYATLQNFPA
ncbi:MAG: hypothetical protein FJ241_01580 [Nitrospira sp.]|nr:hypothetical protein [Nitrospira sp.]